LKTLSHEWMRGRCGFRFARCPAAIGIFCLMVISALTGCQTSKPTPSQSNTDNSSPTAKLDRHHVATSRAPVKDTKLPATPPKQPLVVAPDSAVAKIENAPVVPPAPVSPTETAPRAADNSTAPVSKPESSSRNSLTVSDTVLHPVPPAGARPTIDTSRTAVPPEKIPDAVNLSRLASPSTELSAPNPPAVIRLPTFDDPTPVRSATPSLDVFFRPALPDTDSSALNNSPGLHLATENGQISPATVRSNEYSALPLPAVSPVSWPTNIRSAAPALDLSSLITSPAPAPQPALVTTHEARDNLHQKVYNFILGN
jgi:hypothetical protein